MVPYVYKYDATADTAAFYAGSTIEIMGATRLAMSGAIGAVAALASVILFAF